MSTGELAKNHTPLSQAPAIRRNGYEKIQASIGGGLMNTNRAITTVALAAAGILGLTTEALAVTKTTSVAGSMSPTQETCLQGLINSVGDGENCMYDGGPAANPTFTPQLAYNEVTGPFNHIAYYDSVATPAAFQTTINGSAREIYMPTDGDGKMSQKVSGTVTVDDGGNGFGADDLISFTLTLTSSGSGSIVRVYSGNSSIEKYDSMTQVLAPTVANFVTPNGSGGFDYVIGSEGFPTEPRLTYTQAGTCQGLFFGDVECGHSFTAFSMSMAVDPDFWNGASAAGIGSLENNLGAKTTGTVVNLQCIDSRSSSGVESLDCVDSQTGYAPWVIGPCAVVGGCTGNQSTGGSVRGGAEDVAWDHLLLKVSTNATGRVLAVKGFNVDDYRVFYQVRCGDNTTGTDSYTLVCNSWTTGYFSGVTLDTDADGINDHDDNCRTVSNASQVDSNGDGFGNRCDGDLNNNNATNAQDYVLFRQQLGQTSSPPNYNAADLNANGAVNAQDYVLFRGLLGSPPGPGKLP